MQHPKSLRVSAGELKVLKALREIGKRVIEIEKLEKQSNLKETQLLPLCLLLQDKGVLKVIIEPKKVLKPTEEGLKYLKEGFPEERLLYLVSDKTTLKELSEKFEPKHLLNIAIQWAVKKKLIRISKENGETIIHPLAKEYTPPEKALLEKLAEKTYSLEELSEAERKLAMELKRRKLLEIRDHKHKKIVLQELGEAILRGEVEVVEEVAALTSEMIVSGKWRKIQLKKYDVTASPPKISPAKKHFFNEFIELLKEILVSMGFQEYSGDFVETEFWNFDVLFQAQDHPAREVHGCFKLKYPSKGDIDETLAEKVKATHEKGWITKSTGWEIPWSIDKARNLILRSQMTVVSVRFLYKFKEPPVKVFSIGRVFRPDALDATHSMEFHHLDGIIMDESVNFRSLLGILKEFLARIGLTKLKFKPAYFPFTEPSVEVYAYHDRLGWMEVLGAGMFRPEVLLPLDIKYPVLAWGMGVERLAMAVLGIDDIRKLYTRDLSFLREFSVPL